MEPSPLKSRRPNGMGMGHVVPDAKPFPKALLRSERQPVLSVKRKAWRMDDEHAHVNDETFKSIRQSVIEQHQFTCQCCGFLSQQWLEVHHKDDDHGHNHPDNLLPLCNLCHLVHHVGHAAIKGWAFISYVPELTQTEINHLVRGLIIAKKVNPDEFTDKYESLMAIFKNRGMELFKRAGFSDTANIFNVARAMSETMSDAQFANRLKTIHGLRVIPLDLAFSPEHLNALQIQYSVRGPVRGNTFLFTDAADRLTDFFSRFKEVSA